MSPSFRIHCRVSSVRHMVVACALIRLISDCGTNTQSSTIDVLIYNAAVVEWNESQLAEETPRISLAHYDFTLFCSSSLMRWKPSRHPNSHQFGVSGTSISVYC